MQCRQRVVAGVVVVVVVVVGGGVVVGGRVCRVGSEDRGRRVDSECSVA